MYWPPPRSCCGPIPVSHVSVGTLKPTGIGMPVQQVVAQLMGQREVPPTFGLDRLIVDYAP